MNQGIGQRRSISGKAAWRVEKQALHDHFADQLRKLHSGCAAGKRRHNLQRDFFRNPKVKLAAVLKATKGRLNREKTHALAGQVAPFAAREYLVKTYEKEKGTGGRRTICILPPVLSATHKIIKCALDAELIRHPTLFGVKNFGRDKAAEHIQRLQQEGYSELWQTDIKDCFASFNLDALYDLPLHHRIIFNALDTRNPKFSFQAFPSKQEAKKGASPETPHGVTPVNHGVQEQGIPGPSTDDIACNTRGPHGPAEQRRLACEP